MKACVIQPYYSMDYADSDRCFERNLALLGQCDDSLDLIVLPESCDMPALAQTSAQRVESIGKYNRRLLDAVADTARRCRAMAFVNACYHTEKGNHNTTYAFDRSGAIVGRYDKKHLTPGEGRWEERDSEYSFDFSTPTVLELEGLRFGFLTCYDFYFYEYFSALARQRLDIIIGCSHQRSDTHDALETMGKFIAYNTNAYLVRASVSLGEDSPLGGMSLITAPTGKVLTKMGSRIGLATAEFDPREKYYKPAGFGNPPAAHWEYVEAGRRPWIYRPGGSAIVRTDELMPYPRTCAHRGFNTIAPENSMPAFGAAVALGAEEIEFDLWYTKDGEIVSVHDRALGRVSDGEGFVFEHTYDELCQLDFGAKYGEAFRGLRILRFEDILKKFACHTIMNIHLKTPSNTCGYERRHLQKIVDLIRAYDCEKYVYLMIANEKLLAMAQELAPDLPRCVGRGEQPYRMVELAIRYGCKKIQLYKKEFTREMIERAHANGIVCNVFFADTEALANEYLDMGIDTILTNDYNRISQVVNRRAKYRRP